MLFLFIIFFFILFVERNKFVNIFNIFNRFKNDINGYFVFLFKIWSVFLFFVKRLLFK